jgi:hypothetical protein
MPFPAPEPWLDMPLCRACILCIDVRRFEHRHGQSRPRSPSQNNSLFIKSEKSNLILFALTRQQLFSTILHQRWFSKKKFKCKSTGKHCHRLGRIEQPVTGIPRFNRKGSKTAKMREEIYRIFAFLCVFAVQVFQSKSQTSMRPGISKTPRSLGGLTHPETV